MADHNAWYALTLSAIAGLSTLLGAVVVAVMKKRSERLVCAALGFAAGVMLTVSFVDLYNEAKIQLTEHTDARMGALLAAAFILLGILIAMGLDRFVPHAEYDEQTHTTPHNDLFRVGFISTLAIGLHNLPEGIATFMTAYDNTTLGISIAVAIALHNIPEGITVAMPIYYATGSKKKAVFYCFLSGIAEPVGALLAFLILRPFINGLLLGGILAAVAGIMIYISIEELIPSSRQYGHDAVALLSTLLGVLVMLLSHVL